MRAFAIPFMALGIYLAAVTSCNSDSDNGGGANGGSQATGGKTSSGGSGGKTSSGGSGGKTETGGSGGNGDSSGGSGGAGSGGSSDANGSEPGDTGGSAETGGSSDTGKPSGSDAGGGDAQPAATICSTGKACLCGARKTCDYVVPAGAKPTVLECDGKDSKCTITCEGACEWICEGGATCTVKCGTNGTPMTTTTDGECK